MSSLFSIRESILPYAKYLLFDNRTMPEKDRLATREWIGKNLTARQRRSLNSAAKHQRSRNITMAGTAMNLGVVLSSSIHYGT